MGSCKSKEEPKKVDNHGSIYKIFRLLSHRESTSHWRKRHVSSNDLDNSLNDLIDKKIKINDRNRHEDNPDYKL